MGCAYTFSARDEMQRGTNEVANPNNTQTMARIVTFSAGLGLWRNLSLGISLPILRVTAIEDPPPEMEQRAPPEMDGMEGMDMHDAGGTTSVTGLGDISLVLHYLFVSEQIPPTWRLGFGAGVYLPTGGTTEEEIPANAAFRSGTVDPLLTYNGSYDFPSGFGLFTVAFARLVLAENADRYRASHSISYGGGVRYSFRHSVVLSLGVTALHRFHDESHGQPVADTGGDWLYLSPAVSYQATSGLMKGLSVFIAVNSPVYQRLNATQLAEDFNFSFGVGYGFRMFGGPR
jgi:hypothetical protein